MIAYRDGHPRGQTVPLRDAVKITIDAAWGLITLVIILGGILGGVFTAVEAGAVACVWAFLVTMFIYRDYRWRDLPALVHRTMRTVAMVMTLIACASSVGYVMALTQMPAKITAFFLTISSDKNVILFLINIMLLMLGCLVDMAPSILICTPILLPVMREFRRRSGSLRHDHDAQPRHRTVPSAGRRDPVRRLRGRQSDDRSRSCARSGRSMG